MIGIIIDKIKNIFGKGKWVTNMQYPRFGCIPDKQDNRDIIYEVARDLSNTKCSFYRDRYYKDEAYRKYINKIYNQEG